MTNKLIESEIVKNPSNFTLGRINTDESEELVLDYKIEGVPTLILLNSDLTVRESNDGKI